MAKHFNVTGTCIPHLHYMADMSQKLARMTAIVEGGNYFAVNRPRQYGKTTMIFLLEQLLQKKKDYLPIDISFEEIDSATYEKHERFIPCILRIIKRRLDFMGEKELAGAIENKSNITGFDQLSEFLTEWIPRTGRKVVLMIDEVDKAANNQLFLDFLGMLRAKFLKRNEGKDYSFHSVLLAGVHDIKSLKTKIRPYEKKMYNSPWNIAVEFDVDLNLSIPEIASMLEEYARESKVKIDVPLFAQKLFYYTSGHPFLVSFLCKIIDEKILPAKIDNKTGMESKPHHEGRAHHVGRDAHHVSRESHHMVWESHDIEVAVQKALRSDSTNFDSLIKNLENNPELYEFVFKIIMNGMEFSYNRRNSLIQQGALYGILSEKENKAKVQNRLYEQLIYDHMSSGLETGGTDSSGAGAGYIGKDGSLDIEKAIRKFQQFMKEQYNKRDRDFIERNGRLLFLAFIKPIINGRGFDFKEVQISEEKRLDVVITFANKRYIVELKIWRGEALHQEGVSQLCDYLHRQDEVAGYLLIFDLRKEMGRAGQWETIEQEGKKIFAAWI
ncbi:MAG: AAA family ATPase [bacterium]|nr:AAA family ATPase [bacterium]